MKAPPLPARILLGAALLSLGCCGCGRERPPGEFIYLTWRRDPTTTMTVNWQGPESSLNCIIYAPLGTEEPALAVAKAHRITGTPLNLHSAELEQLHPGTAYWFRIEGHEEKHRFRTLPRSLDKPLTFVSGGDSFGDRARFIESCRQAGRKNPSFALLGGDLAYDRGDLAAWPLWDDWFSIWMKEMVTPDGTMIPILPVIGNHDLNHNPGKPGDRAPFFYGLFPMPGPQGYNVLDAGDYLSIFLLDSGHICGIEGAQTEWLARELQKRSSVTHRFAVYHVPAYPSIRKFNSRISTAVRENWVPLFEKFGLETAFENHEHTYKRTIPIRKDRPDPTGVIYIGGGAWGVRPRTSNEPRKGWFIANAESRNHVIVTTLRGPVAIHEVIDGKGEAFDRCSVGPPVSRR